MVRLRKEAGLCWVYAKNSLRRFGARESVWRSLALPLGGCRRLPRRHKDGWCVEGAVETSPVVVIVSKKTPGLDQKIVLA